jgi:hypothetical protein
LSDYSTSTKFIRAVSFINFVLIWLLWTHSSATHSFGNQSIMDYDTVLFVSIFSWWFIDIFLFISEYMLVLINYFWSWNISRSNCNFIAESTIGLWPEIKSSWIPLVFGNHTLLIHC